MAYCNHETEVSTVAFNLFVDGILQSTNLVLVEFLATSMVTSELD